MTNWLSVAFEEEVLEPETAASVPLVSKGSIGDEIEESKPVPFVSLASKAPETTPNDTIDTIDTKPKIASEEIEERSAIVEYGAGVPRKWAEGLAKLCAMPPPEGLSPHRWEELQDDAGKFLDEWGGRAAQLGWDALSVFGVEPSVTSTRLSRTGLVWLLRRGTVVAISDESATIRTRSGSTQRYWRGRANGGVPLWTLGAA